MKLFGKKIISGLICILLLAFCMGQASARENDQDAKTNQPPAGRPNRFEPGFSGFIQPMVGIGYRKSLSAVTDDNKQIDSLDQDAASETSFIPMLLWNLGYTLENKTTRFFAGTPEENILEGTFFLEMGIRQKLGDGTVLTAAFIPQIPLIDDEVWQDPFLLGSDRLETDRDSHAFRISAESLLGSPFTLKYGFGTQDIDNDQAGLYLSQQPGSTLTAQDLQSMKRSGDFHQVEVQYTLDLGRGAMVKPGFYYMKGDADGDANSFNRLGGKISITKPMGRYLLFSTLSMDHSDYDSPHPVFQQTRKEWKYKAILGGGYREPFGWKNFMVNLYTGFSKEDANIGFYDSTAIMGGVGITWMF